MLVGITGASGPLGRATAEYVLRDAERPEDVVLTTRTPKDLSDLEQLGASVRHADFNDPGSMTEAFTGIERLLIVSTDRIGARLAQHRSAIEVARTVGVRHIVYTSVPQPVPANPAMVVADHAGTEAALEDSGLSWTALRNNLYAHMQVGAIEQAAATGRLVTNFGDGAAAYVTREDCAAVAAATLLDGGFDDEALDVTGPTAVHASDLAWLAEQRWGKPVEVVQVDDKAMRDGLRSAGLPDEVAALVASFGAATRQGYLATVTDTVERLTARAPVHFADVARSQAG